MKTLLSCVVLSMLPAAMAASVQAAPVSATVDVAAQKGPASDPGVINHERIEYWLKKRGELSQNASAEEVATAIASYTAGARGYQDPEFVKINKREAQNRVQALKAKNSPANASSMNATAAPKTVKVLAVMIDFPDLPYDDNRLTANDTSMFYPDYPVSHYQDLMFSTTGFVGPSGQNILSGYQYYQRESGGEFFFTGDSYGWVTADNNAATYGARSADDEDNDINAPDLIKEAVEKAVAANNINLADYDIEDPFDRDQDGILNEADGFIDHVMIYHSSVGEEAGGGVLGGDAIWSHRFFVNATGSFATMGHEINNTGINLFGYTIQPIDAATGVVVHEFGHDLGLPDLYDTGDSEDGSPVGRWSVMSGGTWAGSIPGTQPTGFSAYGRSELQRDHGANWMNETVIDFSTFSGSQSVDLVEATNHTPGTTNQLKIVLPNPNSPFATYAGNYQYYSTRGDNLNESMTFQLSIPDSANVMLTMKARWDIEVDWDYARVLINDTAIPGNHTTATNQYGSQYSQYADVVNYISGKSEDIAGAEGSDFWVDLTYDVAAYRGQTVTVKFDYVTDTNTGGYGFAVDEIQLLDGGTAVYSNGAESASNATLNGYERNDGTVEGLPQNYWVQLRSHNENDDGLATVGYDRGVVVWFHDTAYSNNRSAEHPGRGLLGVVDADQNMIGTRSSSQQVRDAAFSMFDQLGYNGDFNLAGNSVFDDQMDYSSPSQPQSGIILPVNGLRIEVTSQAADSSTATIQVSKQSVSGGVVAGFSSVVNSREVTFTNTSTSDDTLTYSWNFGDGSAVSTETNPVHTYASDGVYQVTLTSTNTASQNTSTSTQSVRVGSMPSAGFSFTANDGVVSFTDTSSGGIGALTYAWQFGDGGTSTQASPTHTYSATGNYLVELTVTDSTNAQNVTSLTVNVQIPVVEPEPEPESSGGGGSMFWTVLLLAGLGARRR